MRLWKYPSTFHASKEALALAQGMDSKHAIYHTGFGGSKIVVDCDNPSGTARALLLDEVADVLNEFEGTMYTGGDLNTTDKDMEFLYERTPYVLAGLCNPVMDPNMATAYGVVGSILGLGLDARQTSFFVHGCGKVGQSVARILLEEHGAARVYVYDQDKDRMASVHGSTPVTGIVPEHDVFVPCSASGIVDEAFARALPAKHIVGATNLPFLNETAEAIFGGNFVPECISSAGAVIVDSVEHFNRDKFELASPAPMYRFVQDATEEKTREFMRMQKSNVSRVEAIKRLSRASEMGGTTVGRRFFSTARNPTYDVAIAGAGIMGLATAFQLKRWTPRCASWCASGRLPWAMDPRGGAPVSCAPFTPSTRPCSWPWMAWRPTAVGGSSWAFGTWKPPSPGPVPFGCSESPGASTRLSRAGWQPSAWTLKSWTRGTCDVLFRPFAPTRT